MPRTRLTYWAVNDMTLPWIIRSPDFDSTREASHLENFLGTKHLSKSKSDPNPYLLITSFLSSDREPMTVANLLTDCLVKPSKEHEVDPSFLDYKQKETN